MQLKYFFFTLSPQGILQEEEKRRIKLLHIIFKRKYDSSDVVKTLRALRSFIALNNNKHNRDSNLFI